MFISRINYTIQFNSQHQHSDEDSLLCSRFNLTLKNLSKAQLCMVTVMLSISPGRLNGYLKASSTSLNTQGIPQIYESQAVGLLLSPNALL